MKFKSVLLVLLAVGVVAGAAYVGKQATSPGTEMVTAAEKLLGLLNDEQKGEALHPFDSPERTNWHFIPMQDRERRPTRKGLKLKDMKPEQKAAALELLRSGTSASGYKQAITIMSLESILHDLEKGGASVRDPEWYFFSIFGTPSKTGRWGWRVEGHHLSLNFTVDRGKVLSATPAFFGANPATVKTGPRKGLRTLPLSEDLARELYAALDGEQRKAAEQPKQLPEIEQAKGAPSAGKPTGLAAARMNKKQKDLLLKLLEAYTSRMPEEIGKAQLEEARAAGVDSIHFAFAVEDDKPGKPHSYRIQGPTFVVEFLNVQTDSLRNPGNHIHSCWRNLPKDFGLAATR